MANDGEMAARRRPSSAAAARRSAQADDPDDVDRLGHPIEPPGTA